jgi:hypothetical protein
MDYEKSFAINFALARVILQHRNYKFTHAAQGGTFRTIPDKCPMFTSVSHFTCGMVLAEIMPRHPRVLRGLRLSKFAEHVNSIFPQAETRFGVDGERLEIYINPLQRGYFEKIRCVFPRWARNGWRQLSSYEHLFHVEGLTWYEMGAFIWKQNSSTC